ncbi:CaiB/BaiF CoA transferase family protein [Hoyosella subflava]|uniref:L-carnitine dehydratase/bile acid-inducible protein F n=1 Tax=Hoyosella subflava (strain DSM 45089 / JCM 17490 / NBRC 109087 / DQS3-9A1) TaxID=443218 RepID=F6EKJ2_HOYSD|nr:CoA transferase [Hoyosella subflava]AEF39163.1 L-carnitine dehydratase/bile acid-inducible protein F [Hoyosella subflava DQS3-9A1]
MSETTPLQGVRILEMGQLIAGPFTGSRLADFGAEVIKIEPPGRGDPMRDWGKKVDGTSLWWAVIARNKKSVTVDLSTSEGRDVLRELVKDADAIVENFRPGTLERWGIGPEELHKINPGLIIVRISGFGQTGPYASRPGFASVGEAMGGLRYINGFPGGVPPRCGISLGDTLAALFAFEGLLMALYWRDARGGTGQVVDASILESCFAMLESTLPDYDKLGIVREPTGTSLKSLAPSNVYPTKEGRHIVIAANADPMFTRLTRAMNMPELAADPRFATHIPRGENGEEIDRIIAEWSSQLTYDELTSALDAQAVVWGPINSIADIVEDPHVQERGMIVRQPDDRFGDLAIPGVVPRLSVTPGKVNWLGRATPGTDNEAILGSDHA